MSSDDWGPLPLIGFFLVIWGISSDLWFIKWPCFALVLGVILAAIYGTMRNAVDGHMDS